MKAINSNSIIQSLVRYALGVIMMGYGLIKIFRMQFALPAEIYDYPLRHLDGVTITWAFLGFSPWFSVFLGVLELIPGFLLLFRKTYILGAILLLPSLFAVFMINNAYDFWPHMRVFTGLLLVFNLTLLFPRRKLLYDFFKSIANESSGKKNEAVINVLILCLLTFLVVFFSS